MGLGAGSAAAAAGYRAVIVLLAVSFVEVLDAVAVFFATAGFLVGAGASSSSAIDAALGLAAIALALAFSRRGLTVLAIAGLSDLTCSSNAPKPT